MERAAHALFVLGMATFSCVALKGPSWKERNEFQPIEAGMWRYQDARMAIWLDTSVPGELSWRFKNFDFADLVLDTAQLGLVLDGEDQVYTLWGEPRRDQGRYPNFTIQRQNYVAVSYPLQAASPFVAFPFHKGITLQVEARWEDRKVTYSLRFPRPDAISDEEKAR